MLKIVQFNGPCSYNETIYSGGKRCCARDLLFHTEGCQLDSHSSTLAKRIGNQRRHCVRFTRCYGLLYLLQAEPTLCCDCPCRSFSHSIIWLTLHKLRFKAEFWMHSDSFCEHVAATEQFMYRNGDAMEGLCKCEFDLRPWRSSMQGPEVVVHAVGQTPFLLCRDSG